MIRKVLAYIVYLATQAVKYTVRTIIRICKEFFEYTLRGFYGTFLTNIYFPLVTVEAHNNCRITLVIAGKLC